MQFADIETPALLLDAEKMGRNIASMRVKQRSLGVALRPHLKTSKCIEIAHRLVDRTGQAICVSTLKEAEYFYAHGFTDILYAVGIAPGKLKHVADLRGRGCDLKIILDNRESAEAVSEFCRQQSKPLPTLIEIDSDGNRAGVMPDADELLPIGRLLGSSLCGVMTHAGASYDCRSVDAIRAMAEQERARAVLAAERLRRAGMDCTIVSVGSTPTALHAEHLNGVTEVRAGVFVFQDLVMAGLGVCRVEDIAISVLCAVIGQKPDRGWLITDAGWMAMSRDRGTARQSLDQGYGLVCDESGVSISGLMVIEASQEHGILAHRSGNASQTPLLPVGTRLRILPNHACATAAQHGCYHVIGGLESGGRAEETWPAFFGLVGSGTLVSEISKLSPNSRSS